MSTLLRYVLLQVPGIVLLGILLWLAVDWGWLSSRLALLVMATWLLKDALLYPVYRPALEGGRDAGPGGLVGLTGIARTDLDPRGLVEVAGERWQARCARSVSIRAGSRIRVRRGRGMVLEVEAVGESPQKKESDR